MRPSVPDQHHLPQAPLRCPIPGQGALPGFDHAPTGTSLPVIAVSPSTTAMVDAPETGRVPKGPAPLLDYLP